MMDAQATQLTTAAAPRGPQKAAKEAAGDRQTANGNRGKPQGRPMRKGPPIEMYRVHATIMYRTMKIGDQRLATEFFKEWQKIHHALHWITDFARTRLKGRVVRAANRGVEEYLAQKTEEAVHMLAKAQEMAESNGVRMGQHGSWKEEVIEVACPAEKKVMHLTTLLDDYIIVMDTLWYEEVIDSAKKDDAHAEVVRVLNTLSKLVDRIKLKLIDYKKKELVGRLGRPEEMYEKDVMLMVLNIAGINLEQKKPQGEKTEKQKPKQRDVNKAKEAASAQEPVREMVAEASVQVVSEAVAEPAEAAV